MDDRPSLLFFGLEYAEPAKLYGFALRQAGHYFIETGLENRRRLADGKAVFLDERFYDVGFFHGHQWVVIHFWISVERSAVSLAVSFSSCRKRYGRSDVDPVTAVIAAFTSAAMIVGRSAAWACLTASLVNESARVSSCFWNSFRASAAIRIAVFYFIKVSTVLGFVMLNASPIFNAPQSVILAFGAAASSPDFS